MTRAAPRTRRLSRRRDDSRRRRGPALKPALRFLGFSVLTISLTLFMAIKIIGPGLGDDYTLVATFDNISGLESGDLVKVAGAPVGRVDGVKVVLGRAEVRLSVDRKIHMPADSEALIRWRNLIGKREVYLQPGQSTALLTDGGRINRTQSTVDLGTVVNSLGPLTGSLDPTEINQILQTFATALNGNEGNINQIIGNLGLLLNTFGDRTETIDQMIKDYTTVSDTVGHRDQEIAQTIDNLQTLTQAFATSNGTLSTALVQLNRFTTNLNTVTSGNEKQLGQVITSSRDLLAIAHQNVKVLGGIVKGLPSALQALLSALSGGHFVRTAMICINVKVTAECPFTETLPPPPAAGGASSGQAKTSAADQATFARLASMLLLGGLTNRGG